MENPQVVKMLLRCMMYDLKHIGENGFYSGESIIKFYSKKEYPEILKIYEGYFGKDIKPK